MVAPFAEVLKGAEYLNTAANPVASFVSDSFVPESPFAARLTAKLKNA